MAMLGLTVIVDDAEVCCCSIEGGSVDRVSALYEYDKMEYDGAAPYCGDDLCVHSVDGWW